MWLFLLATRHRMQALSALACSVGCAFLGFESLKIALFIQPNKKVGNPIYFWVAHFYHPCSKLIKVCAEFLAFYLSCIVFSRLLSRFFNDTENQWQYQLREQ